MSANTAIHSVAWPMKSSTMNAALIAMLAMMFCHSTDHVARLSRRKRGSAARSSSISATSAVSSAASVPAAPIAIPTSALARAGASFTPSPTIATIRPSATLASTQASFSSGNSSACTLSIPASAAIAAAVVALSPVSRWVRIPSLCSSATADLEESLSPSATAMSAIGPSSPHSTTAVRPCLSWCLSRPSNGGEHSPSSWIQRWLPIR